MSWPDDTAHADAVRRRFARTAALVAERERARRESFRAALRSFLPLRGDERVLDSGAGTGALALALAPLVREVVAVDVVPELLEQGRRAAGGEFPNVRWLEGDATRLPFETDSFDLAGCHRTLHHIARPELAVAELARVTRLGGSVLIIDQIAPADPLAALELDRFERVRDPSHTRLLPDTDVHSLLDANGLVLKATRYEQERRELDRYLDLAGCEGAERETAAEAAPGELSATVGWYLAAKPIPRVSLRA
ncbi:MAG TPA: methyltransferase domain-containing protein [Gaiellaceae bacterium]|nr:methyltransferase domain-containing protein [Gaiellaceae bacterium]